MCSRSGQKNKQINPLKLPKNLINIKQGGDVKVIYLPLASNGEKEQPGHKKLSGHISFPIAH